MGNKPMNKLNLAIVGCGESANDFALVSKLIPNVKLAAACDLNRECASAYGKKHRVPIVLTDYSALLALDGIDAVCLATPHDLHYEMIIEAVQAGKHVLTEKPTTRTYAEVEKLIPQISDKKVGVNYQYRYDSGCYAMVRAVQKGELGIIRSVRINVPWHREQTYFEYSSWHKSIARAGGGTLITQASHFLDVALWALNDPPASAMGYSNSQGFDVEVDTITHAVIETQQKALISITSSMIASSSNPVTIEFYGDRGTAYYKSGPLPGVCFKDVRVKKERPPIFGFHAYQRSLAGFTNWVLKDQPYLIPAIETLPVLAAVDAIYRSAKSGKREVVELIRKEN